jgi:hypothetical protein
LVRALLVVLVASLAISALLGVLALTLGEFGDLEVRILLTTLALGLFSLTGLGAAVRLVRRSVVAVGILGIAASGVALGMVVLAVWVEVDDAGFIRLMAASAVVAVGLAYASLLLLVPRRSGMVTALVAVSLAALAAGCAILLVLVLTDLEVPETVFRLMGAAGIVALFGTLAAPIMAAASRPA